MEPSNPQHSLSDISHLFLSSVRDRHTNGVPLPRRRPPGQRTDTSPMGPGDHSSALSSDIHSSTDLTPEELARVLEDDADQSEDAAIVETQDVRIPPITAILGAHLNGSHVGRAREYARHLAASGLRVGFVEVDASEFRVMCFDAPPHGGGAVSEEAAPDDYFEARTMTAALNELSWDLDRWLLVLPNPRTCEARQLLREVSHWALLSTCDHDGVISSYRALKGVSELLQDQPRPRLSLALLDAADDDQSLSIHRKLGSVCQQFLSWPIESEPDVLPADGVAEHLVVCCRPTRDKAQLAIAPQWAVVSEFLARAKAQSQIQAERDPRGSQADVSGAETAPIEKCVIPETPMSQPMHQTTNPASRIPAQAPIFTAATLPAMAMAEPSRVSDVIDLPDASETAILAAVLRGDRGALIECPVIPPMCADSRLAVTRDRGLILLAVARQGLSELRSIAQAYRWLVENRALIGMAMPQLSIDAHQHPRLRLLVDQADLTADVLAPMLQSGSVTVQPYRKLRWGGKTGLLLEAA